MNDSKLTNGQITKYSMMGLTQFMAMMPAFMYYRTFLQVNLKVPAEMLAVLVLIGTGVDFLLSLVAGPVVEKSTGGKWGKFRIFFATFPWIMFVGAIVVFIAPASIGSPLIKGLITIVGYIMIVASVSFMGNANFGVMAAMAGPSLTDRNRMSVKAAQMMALATIVTSLTILPIKTAIYNATGNEQLGYLIVSALFGATVLFGAKCVLDVSKPYDLPRPAMTPEEKAKLPKGPSVGAMFASVAKNPQLLVLMLVYTIYNFGFNFAAGFEMYFFMFWKLTPATFTAAYTIHATVRSVASYVGAMIGPTLGNKLGKKKALWVGLGLWGLGLLGAYLCIGGTTPWYFYTIFASINAMAMYIFAGFGVNYFLDAGEYGYYKTGEDNRTIAMAMFNIPIKIATMVAGTMSGLALGWINFDSVSIYGGAVTPEIQKGFLFWFTLFPAICMFVATALVIVCYKISDKDAAFYAAENAKKMPPMPSAPQE